MKQPQKYWDKMAKRYAKQPIKDVEAYQKKLAITQEYFHPDWRIFEFGCGTGTTAIHHASHVEHVFATDISPRMIEIAEQKSREAGIHNIKFQQGSVDSPGLEDEAYNAVLGLNILHLLEDVGAAIKRAHALLKPGGIFVSSTALIGQLGFGWRIAIWAMQVVGLAPYVNFLEKEDLLNQIKGAGFDIDYEWQPKKASLFIVAKKPVEIDEVS
jgi:ubiquinone/menaquinone biosynthesis C-methylase UbiE